MCEALVCERTRVCIKWLVTSSVIIGDTSESFSPVRECVECESVCVILGANKQLVIVISVLYNYRDFVIADNSSRSQLPRDLDIILISQQWLLLITSQGESQIVHFFTQH